jgi:hypothetical protein
MKMTIDEKIKNEKIEIKPGSDKHNAYFMLMLDETQLGNYEVVNQAIDELIDYELKMGNSNRESEFNRWCISNWQSAFTNYMTLLGRAEMITSVKGEINPRLQGLVVDMFNNYEQESSVASIFDPGRYTEQKAIVKSLVTKYDLKLENDIWVSYAK